ncbi:ABC transporter ATP-binding protein [Halopiger goleimassiliensis]|uniref:ABC transporter ATP-binding protein n=1 Tax=Halopiger goleimassiliensis TaxID=1293048 RepID=UPI0009DC49D6|nr:ABC transporter ATP-binding protein [Halopiger goleimassiliensis]
MTGTEDATVIEVADVSFRYPGATEPTLSGASLEIEAGEFVAILGGNGSGKTTLCKTFNGLVPHFFDGDFDGRVTVAGTDVQASSVAELSETVGYVFQEFENQLVTPTVFEELTFGPLNYGRDDYRERAYETLDDLELPDADDRFVWELSGGQQHLVALGAALSMEPEILVVDEPAAQLDPMHAEATYDRLQRLNNRGMTIVAIEHHTEFVAEYCDSVVLVDDGRVAWKRPTDEALNRLEDLRERRLHPPQVTRVAERVLEEGPYPTTFADALGRFRSVSTPEADGDRTDASTEPPADREPIVTFRDVDHGYSTLRDGDLRIFEGLSLEFGVGERVALVGANGAGKSTLLRLVTGLERPDGGTVVVDGTDTSEVLPETLASDVTYVDQNPEEMFIRDSVREDVAYYLRERGADDVEERVDEILSFLDLEGLADRDGRLLSVGEQRRASLAIGLATDPAVLLFDEPTGSLDLASRREVGRTIERADDRVETVIVATHDLELVAEWATRVVALDDGVVRADGPPRDVLADPDLLEACNLRPPQVVQLSRDLGRSPPALTVEELAAHLTDGSTTGSEVDA